MHTGAIEMRFDGIKERLVFPRSVVFSNHTLVYEPYNILCVKPEDIFFVSPALFLWIDEGIQNFNGLTTAPRYLKLVDSKICKLPVTDFEETKEKYSHLLMICNLTFNPNLSSSLNFGQEIERLKHYQQQAKKFFTAENYEAK